MALIVQKFGGTSVANIERIEKVAEIIAKTVKEGHQVIVIVSAMAGTTNSLISKCHQVSNLSSNEELREYDAIVSSGEIITSALLALKLQSMKFKAMSLQGWQVPIHTDYVFGHALVQKIDTNFLQDLINNNIIPVITGFQGVTESGMVTTLGRGGSDASAVLIASAIGAESCDIYTDVDGVYSADPRIVHKAKKIDHISPLEMLELCSGGAKVLHPRAALAGYRYDLDIRVLSSFNESDGTLISSKNINMEQRSIRAITSNKNLIEIEIEYAQGSLLQLLQNFAKESLQIQHMNNYEQHKVSIIANLSDQNKFGPILSDLKTKNTITNFTISSDISTVTLVGYAIKNDASLIYQTMAILEKNGIKVKAIFSSEIQNSLLLAESDTEKAIRLLHESFF